MLLSVWNVELRLLYMLLHEVTYGFLGFLCFVGSTWRMDMVMNVSSRHKPKYQDNMDLGTIRGSYG